MEYLGYNPRNHRTNAIIIDNAIFCKLFSVKILL